MEMESQARFSSPIVFQFTALEPCAVIYSHIRRMVGQNEEKQKTLNKLFPLKWVNAKKKKYIYKNLTLTALSALKILFFL